MSTPVTVTRGLASSSPTAARPEPAPTSTTRPDPDARNCSVGSGCGVLMPTAWMVTRLTAAHSGRNARRDDQPSPPTKPESKAGKPAKQRNRNQLAPDDRPAVAEVVGKWSCHGGNGIDPLLNPA